LSDRKYRQPGYMDSGGDRSKGKSAPQPRPEQTFGPRVVNMPGTRTVSRCAQCGAVLPAMAEPASQCPKCGFALHSCKQCTHFDPASRFECGQPIPERIAKKDAHNNCSSYSVRVMVEKETTAAVRANDARKAFENLFKK